MRAVVIGAILASASHTMADPGGLMVPTVATPQGANRMSVQLEGLVARVDRDPIAKPRVIDPEKAIAHLRGEIFKLEETNHRMKAELERFRSQTVVRSPLTHAQAMPIDAHWRNMFYACGCIGYGMGGSFLLSIVYKLFSRWNHSTPVISMNLLDGEKVQLIAATAPPLFFTKGGLRTPGAVMSGGEGFGGNAAMHDPEPTGAGDRSRVVKMSMYYAVRGGPFPGVYSTWDEAKRNYQGYSCAQCQKFNDMDAATSFVAGASQPHKADGSQKKSKSSKKKQCTLDLFLPQAEHKALAQAQPDELALYTDGACKGNNHVALKSCPAGWGVAVVGGGGDHGNHSMGTALLVTELYGPVVVDSASDFFLGAEVSSNNTGELSGICEALLWLLDHETSDRPAAIFSDSTYAGKITSGENRAKKNKVLAAEARSLLQKVRLKRKVRLVHVKGHSNDKWNDAADDLANRGASGQVCSTGRYASGSRQKRYLEADAMEQPPAKRMRVDTK